MKTRLTVTYVQSPAVSQKGWVVDLRKTPYMVAYPCCDVLDLGLETTRCWVCGEHGGYALLGIPLWNPELFESIYKLVAPGKGSWMNFSRLSEEDKTWHP